MKLSTVFQSRFVSAHYIVNIMTFMAFISLRQRIEPTELMSTDLFGFTRESTIWVSAVMVIGVRLYSSPTLDAFVGHAFKFIKAAMLVILFYMSPTLLYIFGTLWLVMFAVLPQPRVKDPSVIQVLNRGNFDSKVGQNEYMGFWVVFFHATWSPLCTQLAPLFGSIASEYDHYRMKFGKVDISMWPDLAERYSIDVGGTSRQVPTFIVFKMGQEVARLPAIHPETKKVIDDVAKTSRQGILDALDLPANLVLAKKWEEEARKKHAKQQIKDKSS